MTTTTTPPADGSGDPKPAFERVAAAWLAREVEQGQRLDPAALARQAGVSATVARQWLRAFRAARHGDPTLAGLRGEPAEHRPASPEELAGLRAAYAGGGRPDLEPQPPADHALERIGQLYHEQEQAHGRRLDPAEVARQVGVGRAYAAQTLAALRGGTMTTAERIEQLWR